MNAIERIDTVKDYNDYFGIETLHPLVTVMRGEKAQPLRFCPKLYGLYVILLKDTDCGALKYGRSLYDYTEGSMLFIAPGQVMGSQDDGRLHRPSGMAVAFHPEFLRGTQLAEKIKGYSYFAYSANEALHLSERERKTVTDCIAAIQEELEHPIDKHSRSLIIDKIKLLLDYCIRFYDRQFITREPVNSDLLARFESILDNYFADGKAEDLGLPTVQYCAQQLCLSPNYLSDLIKKTTGVSALKHIQQKTVTLAQHRLCDMSLSISQVAYSLGFPYPQHFSRWFKTQTGSTPNEYRHQLTA